MNLERFSHFDPFRLIIIWISSEPLIQFLASAICYFLLLSLFFVFSLLVPSLSLSLSKKCPMVKLQAVHYRLNG